MKIIIITGGFLTEENFLMLSHENIDSKHYKQNGELNRAKRNTVFSKGLMLLSKIAQKRA